MVCSLGAPAAIPVEPVGAGGVGSRGTAAWPVAPPVWRPPVGAPLFIQSGWGPGVLRGGSAKGSGFLGSRLVAIIDSGMTPWLRMVAQSTPPFVADCAGWSVPSGAGETPAPGVPPAPR